MTGLPQGMVDTLEAIRQEEPFVLFIRHAEREPLPDNQPYADVPTTVRGRSAAVQLGHLLRRPLRWAAVSPFRRCRETAQALLTTHSGSEAGMPIEDDPRLGSPGPWILDRTAGAKLFSELGTDGTVRAQMAGQCWPFVRSLAAGREVLLTAALDRLAAGRGPGACVSHDAVLMPAITALTGDRFEAAWLDPLDGFAIVQDERASWCLYRGQRWEVES